MDGEGTPHPCAGGEGVLRRASALRVLRQAQDDSTCVGCTDQLRVKAEPGVVEGRGLVLFGTGVLVGGTLVLALIIIPAVITKRLATPAMERPECTRRTTG